jgi:3-dehydroquinate synthase
LEKYGELLYSSKLKCHCADEVISLSIEGMKEELENNLWEKDLKRLVDFGHSFSPIIEMKSITDTEVDTLTHGQAVALDVIFSSCISYIRDMLSYDDIVRIIKTAKNLGLSVYHTSFTDSLLLLESLNDTIKHRNGAQNLPIPKEIGNSIFVNDLTYDEICKTILIYKKVINE